VSLLDRLRGGEEPAVSVLFVCVENAGRSQMAAAFAEREAAARGIADRVAIGSAGTHPADTVHEPVVAAMEEVGVDVSDRVPTVVDVDALESVDYLVTMGCYIPEFNPELFGVEYREWSLPDPAEEDLAAVRTIRDAVEAQVVDLFDHVEAELEEPAR
jgi:arsenate reductase